MMDDELNQQFTRRLKKLRGHWLHILEAACGCALVALIVSLFLPKIYRATTYVLVSESKIGAASKDTAALQLVTLPTFTPFVDNDASITESGGPCGFSFSAAISRKRSVVMLFFSRMV